LNNKDILPIDDTDFKDEEIDDIVSKLKEFGENFDTLQKDLDEAHEKYQEYFKTTQENIKKINNSIQFIESCNKEYENDEKVKSIIDSLVDYIKSIEENNKLSEYKSEYIIKRKLLNRHIYLMNKVNNWNTSAICPICITDKVDSYCNPCGHTSCRKCLDKTSNIVNNVNHNKCPICREHIMDIRKLYFI
jgi:DNA repair exonuclease SbcCD ATPase subunit